MRLYFRHNDPKRKRENGREKWRKGGGRNEGKVFKKYMRKKTEQMKRYRKRTKTG